MNSPKFSTDFSLYEQILEYASPEKIDGNSNSPLEDSWALGVTMYRLCCLEYPFKALSSPALICNIFLKDPVLIEDRP